MEEIIEGCQKVGAQSLWGHAGWWHSNWDDMLAVAMEDDG